MAGVPALPLTFDRHRLHYNILEGTVLAVARDAADPIDDLLAVDDFAKNCVLPVSQLVGATVIKNCDPFVLGPALAMASLPAWLKLWGEFLVSSSNS